MSLNHPAFFSHVATNPSLNLRLVHAVTCTYNFGVPTSVSTFKWTAIALPSPFIDRIVHGAVPILRLFKPMRCSQGRCCAQYSIQLKCVTLCLSGIIILPYSPFLSALCNVTYYFNVRQQWLLNYTYLYVLNCRIIRNTHFSVIRSNIGHIHLELWIFYCRPHQYRPFLFSVWSFPGFRSKSSGF
jgi:hypothetical protein